MTTPAAPADDFEAAKAVFEKLKDLSAERQARVLRWVAEGLGVSPASSSGSITGQLPPGLTGAPSAPLTSGGSPGQKDIKTFVNEKNPRSDNQFAATVAYYYRFEAPPAQRRDSIDAKLLQEATRLVGRSRLSNPRFTLNNAKSQGYLDGSARGEFSINTVGENLVAMTLPVDGRSTAGTSKAKKQRKKGGARTPKVAGRKRR